MKTSTLPDELELLDSKPVQIFDYKRSQAISKQQIVLKQHTFSFLLDGTKEVLGSSALSIDNSEFLIMKAGHCLMTEKLSEVSSYRSVLVFFSNESLLKLIHNRKLKTDKPIENKSVFSFAYDEFIRNFVNSLVDISKLADPLKSRLSELKFEEIILYLAEVYGTDFLLSLTLNTSDSVQKFTQIIESNKLSKLTLKELAFLCNMSVSTFKREFEKYYSESPIKWFQNKRLEHAYYLLNQEQKTSSEVYFEAGYENLSSFIQAYKSKYGVTPKQHQNMSF
jgi:AraC-like DNA-binding protein